MQVKDETTNRKKMPTFGTTGRAPSREAWNGHNGMGNFIQRTPPFILSKLLTCFLLSAGWEPERTYHTPRADRGRSAKSSGGGNRAANGGVAAKQAEAPRQDVRSVTGWEGQFDGAPASAERACRPGLEQASLRSRYQTHVSSLPGPANLGEGLAHRGFDPSRAPYGQQAGWGKEYSSRKEPPLPPQPGRDSTLPHLMNGRVLAGGRRQVTPEHHRPGYMSPDRALVGDEERSALAFALKRMGK